MRAGILFCGGCNPCYDRLACRRRIIEAYPEVAFENACADGSYAFLLVLCGCEARCVRGEGYNAPIFLVASPADIERAEADIGKLLSKMEEVNEL